MVIRFTRATTLYAAVEATPGVPETITGNDAFRANDFQLNSNPNIIESNEFSGTIDAGRPIIGGTPMAFTVQVFLKGSGTAGVAPEFGPLLQCVGFAETINAGVDVQYQVASQNNPSITLFAARNGVLWEFTGVRGDWTHTFTSGGNSVLDFALQGIFVNQSDASGPTPSFQTSVAPIWIGGTFEVDTNARAVQQVVINGNNTLALPDDPNQPEGFLPFEITGRNMQGSMNPLADLVANQDLFNRLRTNQAAVLDIGQGTIAGNIVTAQIPQAVLRGFSEGDRDGMTTNETPFSAFSEDDGYVITLT